MAVLYTRSVSNGSVLYLECEQWHYTWRCISVCSEESSDSSLTITWPIERTWVQLQLQRASRGWGQPGCWHEGKEYDDCRGQSHFEKPDSRVITQRTSAVCRGLQVPIYYLLLITSTLWCNSKWQTLPFSVNTHIHTLHNTSIAVVHPEPGSTAHTPATNRSPLYLQKCTRSGIYRSSVCIASFIPTQRQELTIIHS